jgi:hypothetical protein
LIKRNRLNKIFLCLSCVCFQHQRVFNSNNLGAQSGILHSVQEGGGPSPYPGRHVLLPGCSGPEVLLTTTFQICEWTRTPEILDSMNKRALKTGTVVTM